MVHPNIQFVADGLNAVRLVVCVKSVLLTAKVAATDQGVEIVVRIGGSVLSAEMSSIKAGSTFKELLFALAKIMSEKLCHPRRFLLW